MTEANAPPGRATLRWFSGRASAKSVGSLGGWNKPNFIRTLPCSESYAENHIEREGIRGRPADRPAEAKDKVGFYKICREETVPDWPTLDDERRDSKLGRVHFEPHP